MSDDFHCALLGDGGGGGIRSSVGMLAVPFRPLYERISLLPYILFSRDSLLIFFPQHSSHTPSFKTVIASYKSSSLILNLSISS